MVIESPSGEELLKIQEKKLSIRDKMTIERDGETVATVHKALITPLRERFAIDVEHGEDHQRQGQHRRPRVRDRARRRTVAEISKRWFRVRDTYGIEVAPGENDALILAATVCIDEMTTRD